MSPRPSSVVVGVVGLGTAGLDAGWLPALEEALAAAHPGVSWQVVPAGEGDPRVGPDPPGHDLGALVDRGRQALLHAHWDVALVLTRLPLRLARRTVTGHASPLHQVAVVSVPALGARPGPRAATLGARLVGLLVDREADGDAAGDDAVHQLAAEVPDSVDGVAFARRALTGSAGLLVGMVRANRPWTLAWHLSRTLVGGVAAIVIALVTPDVWLLADRMGPVRLTAVSVAALTGTVLALVVGSGLVERAPTRAARRQVLLFNVATVVTVAVGVLVLSAGMLAASAGVAVLLLPAGLLTETLGHPAGAADLARIAWLAGAVALVGSALGAGLESDDVVRDAAYSRADDGTAVTDVTAAPAGPAGQPSGTAPETDPRSSRERDP